MPSSYIYTPIAKKKVPPSKIDSNKYWKKCERENGRHAVNFYYGDKSLKDVPDYAKIYLSMHGTSSLPNQLFKDVSTRTIAALQGEKYRLFLEISDGRNWIRIDKVAKRMVDDGLFDNNNTHVRIKLYYCDEGNRAKDLAKFFLEILLPTLLDLRSNFFELNKEMRYLRTST